MTQQQVPNFTNGHRAELFHINASSGWSSFSKFHWSKIPGHFTNRDRRLSWDCPGQTGTYGKSRKEQILSGIGEDPD